MPSHLAHQLAGVQAKLDFADECVDTLDGEWHGPEYIKAIRVAFDYDPQTEWHTAHIIGIRDMPRLCMLAGASLNQARSALEHMVYNLVKRNHKRPTEHHSFPIWDHGGTGKFWLKNREPPATPDGRHGKLYGVKGSAVALIEKMQPYHAPRGPDASALWALHQLARKDRHQTLAQSLAWADRKLIRPLFMAPDGCEIVGYRNLLRDPNLNALVDGTKLARLRMEPATREPQVKVDDYLPVNIGFGEGAVFQSIQALRDINGRVREFCDILDTIGGMPFSERPSP